MINELKENKYLLKIFLNFIYYFGLIGIICFSIACLILRDFMTTEPSVTMLIASIASYSCGLGIVNELIKINDTLIIKNPFAMKNVRSMQKISIYLFIISAYVFVKDWIKFKAHFFVYDFDANGLRTDTNGLIFVMLGVLVLILAKMFKTAIEIKNENDLTI